MKTINNDLRQKIKMYIKNGIDISDLIRDCYIKGEDLSNSVIKYLHRVNEDLSNTNFYGAIIGKEEGKVYFLNCIMTDCNFEKVKFLGRLTFSNCDLKRSIFRDTFMPDVEYQGSDFSNCIWCHCVLKIGTEEGKGCKFSTDFFKALTKGWGIDVIVKDKEIT